MMAASKDDGRKAGLELKGSLAEGRGQWSVRHLSRLEKQLPRMTWPAGALRIDMSAVTRMDTGGALVLHRLVEQLRAQGRKVDVEGLTPAVAELVELVQGTREITARVPRPRRRGALESLGELSVDSALHGIGLIAFVGEMGAVWLRQLRHPSQIRWREVIRALGEAGHKALPIVGLLSFLLGVVIAYQGGVQLRQYGASIFVADLVGLSMVRELAPLITAIIVAGRTGSAYTAQIGTMQVTEEVDALRSMGIHPLELLVLPKMLALVIALPLLTVYADITGIFGGMVMASAQLDISMGTFFDRLGEAMTLESYLVGLGKAPVFAAIIATLGCYQGFQVTGSAESVGRHTTLSVVQAILSVIVVDAAFSVAFSYLGI